jgi:hypothetical protein
VIYTIYPCTKPDIWPVRDNWNYTKGMYYDTASGDVFLVSEEAYVVYVGRIPVERNQSVPNRE